MKTLTLLRHAKAGWDVPATRDFDRRLTATGRRAAVAIGAHLRSEGLAFDHVVASPAQRVTDTVAEVEAGYGAALSPAWDRRVYLASAATLLDVVRGTPAEATRVLVIGHNPGLEDLVLLMVPEGGDLRATASDKYPTATLAEMTFAVADWPALAPGGAVLTRFVRPRDLDVAPARER